MGECNELDLVSRIATGDENAYRLFFDQRWPFIFANAQKFTKDVELAQDMAQEVFIKLWVKRERLKSVINLDRYLYTVARNIFLDYLRKKMSESSYLIYQDTWFSESSEIFQHRLEFNDLEAKIQQAVKQLPPQMQTVFRLSRFEGLTHEQIAAQMNISRVTSKSYIVRALIMIRRILAEKSDILILGLALLNAIKKNY